MQVEASTVAKLRITGVEGLDPITVFLEDGEPGRGSLTVRCHQRSWCSSWNAMGKDRKVAEFIRSCGADYLINCMCPGLSQTRQSSDELAKMAKRSVRDRRRGRSRADWGWELDELSKQDARRLYSEIDDQLNDGSFLWSHSRLLEELFGSEWWHQTDNATEPNPDWVYLERILDAVQQALSPPPLAAA